MGEGSRGCRREILRLSRSKPHGFVGVLRRIAFANVWRLRMTAFVERVANSLVADPQNEVVLIQSRRFRRKREEAVAKDSSTQVGNLRYMFRF